MKNSRILHYFLLVIMAASTLSFDLICNDQKECFVLKYKYEPFSYMTLECLLTDKSKLRFNKSFEKVDGKNCVKLNSNDSKVMTLRPKKEGSIILKKGMIDLEDLIGFKRVLDFAFSSLDMRLFKGFELNLYEDSIVINNTEFIFNYLKQKIVIMFLRFSTLDFYHRDKKLISCKEFIEAANSTNPRSIFQMASKIVNMVHIYLTENRNKLCPFAFKGFYTNSLYLFGENSFYSKRVLSFSNDTIIDLNSTIRELLLYIDNVELNIDILHPNVFKELYKIKISNNVKKIQTDLFIWLNNVYFIELKNAIIRSLMHKNGIEWIRNINKNINCNLENPDELKNHYNNVKYIYFDCLKSAVSPPLVDIFPDEDFCLYKDVPVNQLVVFYENCPFKKEKSGILHDKISCTYLWITRSYKYLVNYLKPSVEYRIMMERLFNSSDYKSIFNCDFDKKMDLCNKSNFVSKHIITSFEISEAIKLTETIINILSHILSIFGIITNLLIIITISSKTNKEHFKDVKHYSYLRLNSICSCFILLIHLISWLNQCIYPYQVFCPLIRKTVFMQYFKIVVEEVLMSAFKFMNNFTYIGFAINRISLIGKDHNKLVKYMSDLNLIVYLVVTSIISIGLSVIKFFEYEINPGHPFNLYPITNEYKNISRLLGVNSNTILYILNCISDLLNYLIFLIVSFAIDIGMIVKLRQTLNEKLEKSKEYSSKAQQEKKRIENEKALDKTRSMIIWNISLSLLLKLPATSYSFIHLYYAIYRLNPENFLKHPGFARFYMVTCSDQFLCNAISQFANFPYLVFISIQLFFYKHYDKKFSQSYDRLFRDKKSN